MKMLDFIINFFQTRAADSCLCTFFRTFDWFDVQAQGTPHQHVSPIGFCEFALVMK